MSELVFFLLDAGKIKGIQEFGRKISGGKFGVIQQRQVKGDCGLDAVDNKLCQGPFHANDYFLSGLATYDQLGNHGIVIGGNNITGIYMAVNSDSFPPGKCKFTIFPGLGLKPLEGSSAFIRHSMAYSFG